MRAAVLALLLAALAAPALAPRLARAQSVPADQSAMPPRPTGPEVHLEPQSRNHPGPSGYWTGYRPAKGGAYRWRMLGVAAVLLAVTLLLVLRLLRRASRRGPAVTSSSGSSVAPS